MTRNEYAKWHEIGSFIVLFVQGWKKRSVSLLCAPQVAQRHGHTRRECTRIHIISHHKLKFHLHRLFRQMCSSPVLCRSFVRSFSGSIDDGNAKKNKKTWTFCAEKTHFPSFDFPLMVFGKCTDKKHSKVENIFSTLRQSSIFKNISSHGPRVHSFIQFMFMSSDSQVDDIFFFIRSVTLHSHRPFGPLVLRTLAFIVQANGNSCLRSHHSICMFSAAFHFHFIRFLSLIFHHHFFLFLFIRLFRFHFFSSEKAKTMRKICSNKWFFKNNFITTKKK